MKKIIFSSVCAVALLGVNAYANSVVSTDSSSGSSNTEATTPETTPSLTPNWGDLVTEWEGKISPIKTNYEKIVTPALTGAVTTATGDLETKQEAKASAEKAINDKIKEIGTKADKVGADGEGSLHAKLNKAVGDLIGTAPADKPSSAAEAKSLEALKKFYAEDAEKLAVVNKAIDKLKKGEAITAEDLKHSDVSIAGGVDLAAYTAAQGALNTAIEALGKPAGEEAASGLYGELATKETELKAAQTALDEAKAALAKAESDPEAKKLKAELDKLNAELKAYQDIVANQKIIDAGTTAAEEALKTAQTKYDGEITTLKEAVATSQKAYDEQLQKVTAAKTDLDTKANALIGKENPTAPESAAAATTLNELLAFYNKDTETNASKIAEVKKAIEDAKAGNEVTLSTTSSEATGVKTTEYTTAQGKLTTENNALATKEGELNTAKGEVEASEKALADAKQDLKDAQDAIAQAKADLQNALVASPEGQAQAAKIGNSLGELASATGSSSDKLIALLALNGGDFTKITDAETKKDIQKAANEVAQAIIDNKKDEISQSALGALNLQINNMNKRLGEVRGMGADTGVWLRTYGGRFSNDNDHFNYYSTQIGADRLSNIGNADLITGALIGFDKINASTKTKTYSVGAYASYIDNSGFFADAVLKYARASHKKDAWDYKKQNIFLASLEGGYRIEVNNGYIEPSLELITGHVGKYQASHKNTKINVDSFVPLVFKPQVYFGVNIDDLTLRLGGGAVFNAKRPDADISLNNIVTGLNANAKTKLDRNNHGFASVGGSYKFNDNLRLNLGLERSFGGSLTQDYEINATIRYTF